ncbi:hypothetical protein K431DRAFT_338003 [Polychaeton citri CBS 116435]|uniref:Serine aminopeptidase S33 domain-containing protein n=1 Tax=Polychaeton citri CBS 116435 TaxID=1314669 RepID=A0A9P4QAK1_9PEZI|nr:hypothetical protein K431DRAFT_338003 [Polychaeton citri CBS 116435]
MSASLFELHEHTIPTSHIREYPRATADDQEDVLQLAIKQYVPRDNNEPKTGDITIIGAHANGFPKELYEPLWDELHARLKAQGVSIRGIWIADVAWQGQSGILNEHKLGNDPSWMDHSRDMLLMVNHFRSQMKRPIFGIGHSMGAAQLVNLSIMHPRLFTSLILMDPVVQRYPAKLGTFNPARASMVRRDRWPSRKVAEASFRKSKFYQTWDPRVLDLWLEHGLRDLPTKIYPSFTPASQTPPAITADGSSTISTPEKNSEVEVTLSTTKHQEVVTFLRPNYPTLSNLDPWTQPNPNTHPDVDPGTGPNVPFYRPEVRETFYKLALLRPGVFYIFGEESYMSTRVLQADKLACTGTGVGGSGGVKAGRVSSVTVEKVGHLIPMEDVDASAKNCASWIILELERWRRVEEDERGERATLPKEQRGMMSEESVKVMTGDWAQYAKPLKPTGSKL